MINISSLIDLRFKIIKVLKDSKKKLTVEEIQKMVNTHTSAYSLENYSHAIIDLENYGVLNVEYKKGLNANKYKIVGNSIISVSM